MPRTQLDGEQTHCAHERKSRDGEDGTGLSHSDWKRQELLQRAHELDVGGRATMTKPELIDELHGIELRGKVSGYPTLDRFRSGHRSEALWAVVTPESGEAGMPAQRPIPRHWL